MNQRARCSEFSDCGPRWVWRHGGVQRNWQQRFRHRPGLGASVPLENVARGPVETHPVAQRRRKGETFSSKYFFFRTFDELLVSGLSHEWVSRFAYVLLK